MITIGITGTIGAGKGTVVDYLKEKGFVHFSVREFLFEELRKRNLPLDRTHTTMIADEFRRENSPRYILETLYQRAAKNGKNAVIESVRALGEVDFLKSQQNTFLFAVDALPKIRYERISKRKSELDDVSYEEFLSHEQREISDDPTRGNLSGCILRADFVFTNNTNLEDLYAQIEIALHGILKNN